MNKLVWNVGVFLGLPLITAVQWYQGQAFYAGVLALTTLWAWRVALKRR